MIENVTLLLLIITLPFIPYILPGFRQYTFFMRHQSHVVYDPGDIYHIIKVSEVIAVVQFYCQCPHDIIIAHFMALRITAFHPTAKARGLSRRYICNRH